MAGFGAHQAAEQHRRDDGDRIGFEQVRRHARAVADVVADVVRDHRGIARIVFRDARFDLAHQVCADVGALGEDAAAETREDRDQRGTEREADKRVQRVLGGQAHALQDQVVTRDAEQAEAHDQHAGDGAATERDIHCRADARACGFGGADVGAHRHVHADVARRAGEDRADQEADRRIPPEEDADDDAQHDACDADRHVLAVEVGAGAFLDRAGDLLHALVAGGTAVDPGRGPQAIENRDDGARQRQDQTVLLQHEPPQGDNSGRRMSGSGFLLHRGMHT
jgi:hypothetical protein